MRKAIVYAPLLFIPVMLYLGVILFSGNADIRLAQVMFRSPMITSTAWIFTLGDLVLFIGLICLFVEIIKSASTRSDAIVNHALSMLLLVFCVVAFLLFPGFSTSVFFLIMIMCLLDVLAGPIISIVAARRDIGVGERFIG